MQLTIANQLKDYRFKTFRADFIAGLTVAVMLIPQGMAYSLLAGMPPVYGLYASLIALIVYPLFGSSRQLSVGPVALVSIIVLAGLSELAVPMSPEFIELAILTTMVAGVFQIILAFLKMGFLVNFLSHPVISGFTSAAAFIIAISQLKYLFGLSVDRTNTIVDTLVAFFSNIQNTNVITLIIGLGGLGVILLAKRIHKAIPGALISVVIGVLLVYIFRWDSQGVEVVKEVQKGLPPFTLPHITLEKLISVTPLALIICLISFIESLAIAKTISAKNGNYPISANQELLGLGLAKFVGGFFMASPNSGSFTRSAINDQAGAKTGVSSLTAAVFVALTLLFFTSLFYFLPHAILAAIVISAVFSLIDFKGAKYLYRFDRRDFYVWIATFGLTLFLGIQQGVFTGIVLSILLIIYKASKPHYAILGNLPETKLYRNIDRFEEAITDPDTLIFRYDEDILFVNATHFYESARKEVAKKPGVKYFILDASAINHIDSTGFNQFRLLKEAFEKQNIEFLVSRMKGPLRDIFEKNNMEKIIAKEDRFMSNARALRHIDRQVHESSTS
jgi:SulP family sulfate permease